MADIITRLVLQSDSYDSKIKRATQGLLQMEQECRKAGTSLNNISKNNMEYVRSLGQMETVSKTARGKLGELTAAFTEWSLQYKRLTDEEKKGEYGKTLSASLDQLKTRINETKNDLKEVEEQLNKTNDKAAKSSGDGGGALSRLTSKFTKANIYALAAEKGIEAFQAFREKMQEVVSESVRLSVGAEGIRAAFERINQPGLLDELRQATHGTVSDLQLMTQAVKFKDFNLNLKDLGAMLTFAQQKAKDTGQSVDYMVDSIVTGLGRQSKQILDNLGISAAELTSRMNEGATMTEAVADIIRERMEESGDYMETAADRIAQRNAELENSMIKLGDTIRDVFGSTTDEMTTSLETIAVQYLTQVVAGIGEIKKAWVDNIQPLIDNITLISELKQGYNNLMGAASNGNPVAEALIAIKDGAIAALNPVLGLINALHDLGMGGGNMPAPDFKGGYTETIVDGKVVDSSKKASGGYVERVVNGKVVDAYHVDANGQRVVKPQKQVFTPTVSGSGGNRRTGRTGSNTPPPAPEGSIERQSQEIQKLQKAWRLAADDDSREKIKKQIDEMQAELDRMEGKNVFPLGSMAQINAMLSDIAAQQKLVTNTEDWQALEDAAAKYRDELAKLKGTYVDPAEIMGNLQTTDLVVAPVSLGLDEKEMEAFSKKIKDYFKKNPLGNAGESAAKEWQNAAKAIQSVGSAMAQIEDPAAKVMGTIAQAVATIALSYAQATAKTTTPWEWIAFAATGLATMISSIAAIKSATSGFAQGGIVPGNSYSGDLLSTRDYGINSGELILNKAQQGIIASQLEGGGMRGMVLDTQISAEAIRIVLNNNGRRTRRGEYVTTKKYGT